MADATQFDLTGLLNLLKAVQSSSANPEPQPDLPNGGYSSDQATKWISWHSGKLQSFQSLGNSGTTTGSPPGPTPGPAIPTDFPQLPPIIPGPTIPTDYTGTPQGPNPFNIGQPQPGPAVPDIAKMGPPPSTSQLDLAGSLGGTPPQPIPTPSPAPSSGDVGGLSLSSTTSLPSTQNPTPGSPPTSGNTGILRK